MVKMVSIMRLSCSMSSKRIFRSSSKRMNRYSKRIFSSSKRIFSSSKNNYKKYVSRFECLILQLLLLIPCFRIVHKKDKYVPLSFTIHNKSKQKYNSETISVEAVYEDNIIEITETEASPFYHQHNNYLAKPNGNSKNFRLYRNFPCTLPLIYHWCSYDIIEFDDGKVFLLE